MLCQILGVIKTIEKATCIDMIGTLKKTEILCLDFHLSGYGYLTLAGKTCLEKGCGGRQRMTQLFQSGHFKGVSIGSTD